MGKLLKFPTPETLDARKARKAQEKSRRPKPRDVVDDDFLVAAEVWAIENVVGLDYTRMIDEILETMDEEEPRRRGD